MRTCVSFFDDALASLNYGGRIAILISDENRKYLLVQHPGETIQYSTHNVQDTNPDGTPTISTNEWENDPVLFHQVVSEILEVEDFVAGK